MEALADKRHAEDYTFFSKGEKPSGERYAHCVAAAMALSMSAVAFAKDNPKDQTGITDTEGEVASSSLTGPKQTIGIGETYIINPNVTMPITNTTDTALWTGTTEVTIDSEALRDMIEKKLVTVDVSVSSGKPTLDGMPQVKLGKNDKAVMSVKFKDTWGVKGVSATMQIRITAKKNVYWGYLEEDGTTPGITGDASVKHSSAAPLANGDKGSFKSGVILPQGDTITLSKFEVSAKYQPVTAYGANMTITKTEMTNRNILAEGSELYDNADSNDKVIIYFKKGGNYDVDVAAFEVKVAPNQKDVNLGYDTDEPEGFIDQFGDDLDYEFINFKAKDAGTVRFQNSGTLYFNAIGKGNTKVYEIVDGAIDPSNPLDAKYDPDDQTVSISGIKSLGQYVVASDALPYDEPAEDSSSEAPEAPAETPAGNPSTGAL